MPPRFATFQPMLLLTGATGVVGSALLRRLVGAGAEVRCLVRDPRRLGAQRVRVQIALGDLMLRLFERLALLPAMPISGSGRAIYQPIWSEDVADCVMAALARSERSDDGAGTRERYELAGPETLSQNEIVRAVQRALDRRRPLVHIPTPIVSRSLRMLEAVAGPSAFATWDEAELMEVPMISARGTADAERLGVVPQRIGAVLGAS